MTDALAHLPTEAANPASARLDELTAVELVRLMADEDATVGAAVATQNGFIAQAVDAIAARLSQGGRLIYMGAGTSGRLGVLDAAECPPTFQSDPSQVVGLIAGGPGAMLQAVEGAEDSPELGAADLRALDLTAADVVCGIAASGRTPYVLGGVAYARSVGAWTIGVACNPASALERAVDVAIVPVVGPEVLSGSTRLKAGTATKLVLNRLTTGAFVRLGKTFGNLMVDLKASNEKLVARAARIVRTVTGLDAGAATELLGRCSGEVKTALVAHAAACDPAAARAKLAAEGGRVGPALRAAGVGLPLTGARAAARPDLVLGIDGGGTQTLALLADRSTGTVLGRGSAGPSNIMAVGPDAGLRALDDAVTRAFAAAGIPRGPVSAAALGLAGVDRQSGLDTVRSWTSRAGLSSRVTVANDATLLLAAGTPEGWGLAVIAGTGSIAFVRTPAGEVGRAGGWGYTLGDEGSAYMIALNALRATCRHADGAGPATVLTGQLLARMKLVAAPDLIPAVYGGPWDRAAVAGLAPLVLAAAAAGDAVAAGVVRAEATALAQTAAAAASVHGLAGPPVPCALAGGVLLGSDLYRRAFLESLESLGVRSDPVQRVSDPAVGAVVLARRLAEAGELQA